MKKKLLFIIWSNSYGGGAEKQLTNLVNHLSKDKYEIDVIEYLHTNIKPEILSPHIKSLKPVINKEKDSEFKMNLINKLIHKWPIIVRKMYIKRKYDLEISFNYLIPTFLLSKKANTISWIHGTIWDIKYEKEPWLNGLQRKSFKNVNKIVAIVDETKESIDTLYPEYKDKTMVINNGYDFNLIERLSKEFKVKRESKVELLYCNRFDDNKNPLLLIEALNILKNRYDNFHLNFLGKGELESEMINKIKEYKLEKYVDVVGYVKNPYPYYENSDILCITSKSEGFSTSLIEGLYFKKPFIATSGAVTKQIIQENCGIVANTKEEIANALFKLINDKTYYKELSVKSFETSKKYSLENQVKQAESLIDNLLKE